MPAIVSITDPGDPRIASFREVRERDLVGRDGQFIAEGEVVLRGLVASDRHRPVALLIADKRVEKLGPLLAQVPDGVSSEVAAAVLLKGLTAHYLLKSVYPVQAGDAVLVHAGAGGVGLILTEWAHLLGARVITTVSTPEKAELSKKAGADEVLPYPDDAAQFGQRIRELTAGVGVAAVYDGVGATTFDASLASLAVRGTLALFGAASGPVPPVDPQRLNAAGSVFLTRPTLAHFMRAGQEFNWRADELFEAVAGGAINIEVGGRYPLAEATRAHQDLQGRKTAGSIVLLP